MCQGLLQMHPPTTADVRCSRERLECGSHCFTVDYEPETRGGQDTHPEGVMSMAVEYLEITFRSYLILEVFERSEYFTSIFQETLGGW